MYNKIPLKLTDKKHNPHIETTIQISTKYPL